MPCPVPSCHVDTIQDSPRTEETVKPSKDQNEPSLPRHKPTTTASHCQTCPCWLLCFPQMQHQKHNVGSVRGGRPREKNSRRDDLTLQPSAAGRDPALQQEAPHPEWNASDWKRWDESHGHMLWMGALQARDMISPVCWSPTVFVSVAPTD